MSFTAPKPTPIRIRSAFEADSIASFRGRCYQRIEITKTINTPGFFTWFSARSTTMSAVAAKTSGYTLITNRQRNARFICWFYDHYRFFLIQQSLVLSLFVIIFWYQSWMITMISESVYFWWTFYLIMGFLGIWVDRLLLIEEAWVAKFQNWAFFSENEDMFHPRGTLDTSVTIPDFRFSIKMRSSLIC